jgi:hypothetical protein
MSTGPTWWSEAFFIGVTQTMLATLGSLAIALTIYWLTRKHSKKDQARQAAFTRLNRGVILMQGYVTDAMEAEVRYIRRQLRKESFGVSQLGEGVAEVRVVIDGLPSLALNYPDHGFSHFVLDFAGSLKDWVDEALAVMHESLDRGDLLLDDEQRDRLLFLHRAFRHVCISSQMVLATYERGESRPVGNLVAWDMALAAAEAQDDARE